MDKIEAIREKIGECDDIIIEQLAVRMSYIQEIISYKKATGIPILQPEQEKKQTDALKNKLGDNEFEEEILDIFKYIMKNSRRIQAKSLFDYNIFLIGFMGAGKSTIAGELKDKLEMDRVEMDQMIVEKQGMSISEIFDEYGGLDDIADGEACGFNDRFHVVQRLARLRGHVFRDAAGFRVDRDLARGDDHAAEVNALNVGANRRWCIFRRNSFAHVISR